MLWRREIPAREFSNRFHPFTSLERHGWTTFSWEYNEVQSSVPNSPDHNVHGARCFGEERCLQWSFQIGFIHPFMSWERIGWITFLVNTMRFRVQSQIAHTTMSNENLMV